MRSDGVYNDAATALLPTLIVLAAVVMTLEILQHLLLARCVAVALMGVVWTNLFAHELQIRAMLAAVVYHGASELFHTTRNSRIARRGRDRNVILALLFLVRVFIWGAAFCAASSFQFTAAAPTATAPAASLLSQSRNALVLAAIRITSIVVYCEVLEVLVLLFVANDDAVPYDWRRRLLLWRLAALVAVCDVTGLLSAVARIVLVRLAPLAFVALLLVTLWLAPHVPWPQLRRNRSRTSSRSCKHGDQWLVGDDSGDTEELSDEQLWDGNEARYRNSDMHTSPE